MLSIIRVDEVLPKCILDELLDYREADRDAIFHTDQDFCIRVLMGLCAPLPAEIHSYDDIAVYVKQHKKCIFHIATENGVGYYVGYTDDKRCPNNVCYVCIAVLNDAGSVHYTVEIPWCDTKEMLWEVEVDEQYVGYPNSPFLYLHKKTEIASFEMANNMLARKMLRKES